MKRVALLAIACCSRSPTTATASAAASLSAPAAPSASDAPSAEQQDAAPVVDHPERAFALPRDASCHDDLRCLVERAYSSDEKARALALALFDETGDVAGTDRESTMDGGFRGDLHITPALPTGDDRAQLERVLAAVRDFDAFFRRVAPATQYRWRDLSFRFFKSWSGPRAHETQRTTPSAYAIGPVPMPQSANDAISFSLAYNVKGSLLTTDQGVRETLFHEIFHMNDAAHGDWSVRALGRDYDAIVKKCGAMNVACLAPYAPNDTMVRGGTFYAFEPNNGLPVREYAAELALRWYKEHRAIARHEPFPQAPNGKPFKCGPPENRRAWDAIVKEFFAIDLVPPCP